MRAAELVLPVYSGGGGDGSPSNVSAPVVSGGTLVGDTLSCTEGLWTNSPLSYAYQWVYAGTGDISGATSSTYVLGIGDVGYDIYCVVTATNLAGSASGDSNTVGPVTTPPTDPPSNTVAPVVTGSLSEGATLTSTEGSWTNSPTGYAYQWVNVSSGDISGATASTYVLQSSDVGDDIYCAVTATNLIGSTTQDSNTVGPITSDPVPLGIPGDWTILLNEEWASLDPDIWTPGWFATPISNPVSGAENNAYNSDNVSVSGGVLSLALTDVSITAPNGHTYPYTASLMSSQPNGSNTGFMWGPYGVYEARVYMPGGGSEGNGLANWPAVWAVTTPTEDTAGHYNEYDVFEALGGYAAWHFHNNSGTVGANVDSIEPGYHVVSVNWEPGTLTFYYDGTEVGSADSGVLGNAVYLVLNHSVATSQTAVFGSPFLVDYVRIWQAA